MKSLNVTNNANKKYTPRIQQQYNIEIIAKFINSVAHHTQIWN